MSMNFGRLQKISILKLNSISIPLKANVSTNAFQNSSNAKKLLIGGGIVGCGLFGLAFALNESVKASDLTLHSPKYPWFHKQGFFNSLDMASARRGYKVYKQVCSACHSMRFVCYRELVNNTHTEDEAKAEAAEVMVLDGPDETGKMFQRPGTLADYFPNPYPNEEAARYANNGAVPPDLSLITLARHGKEDYLFSLLTGYVDAPAGVAVGDGQHFNPYFPGGVISMAQALYNDVVEYEDGTPPTASQLAKDVSNFLKWAAEPDYNDRMLLAMRILIYGSTISLFCWYAKRHVWSVIKSRKILFRQKSK